MNLDESPHDWQDRLRAERSCERLAIRYFALIDSGRASAAVELFAADAAIEALGNRREGRDAIAGALRAREARTDRATRHVVTNLLVDVTGSDAAATATLLLFVTNAAQPTRPVAISALDMHFTKDRTAGTDEWLIALHRSRRLAEADS